MIFSLMTLTQILNNFFTKKKINLYYIDYIVYII